MQLLIAGILPQNEHYYKPESASNAQEQIPNNIEEEEEKEGSSMSSDEEINSLFFSNDPNKPSEPQPACNCPKRVLLVDDIQFNMIPVIEMLQNHYSLVPDQALNGKIAVELFKAELNKSCGCSNRAY